MANTVTVDVKTLNTIVSRLDKLSKDVEVIKTKLLRKKPQYGSDQWWEEMEKQADRDFRAGKGIKFNSAKKAIEWLNS